MKLPSQRTLLVASGALAALAYHPLWLWEPGLDQLAPFEGWFFLPTNTSPKAVFALAVALTYRKREGIRQALRGRGSPGAAIFPLVAGFALYLWGLHTGATDLLVVSLVLVGFGACLLRAGAQLARALSFPLLMLLFAIPLPAPLTNQLFYDLQLQTARHAAFLLPFLGMPVVLEGNAIYGAHAQFQVVDTCAGLRFIEVLTLLAAAYAGWFPTGRLRTLLRILLALPIAYAFNLVRVCLLILHPASPLSSMHVVQGWAVFLGAVACLVYVDRVALRHLPRRPRAAAGPPTSARLHQPGERPAGGSALALAVFLAALLCGFFWMRRWQPPPQEHSTSLRLPVEIDGWQMRRAAAMDDVFLGSVHYTARVHYPFQRAGETIFVFVGHDDHTQRSWSFLSPKNAFVDAGWAVEQRHVLLPEPGGPRVESVLGSSRQRRLLSHTWYTNTGNLYAETIRAFLALDQSVLRRQEPGRVVRLSTPVGPEAEEIAAARARLLAFAPTLEAALEEASTRAAGPD